MALPDASSIALNQVANVCLGGGIRHSFVVGDILQFVDGRSTHVLDNGSSSRYCHEQYVRLLHIGASAKYDGWLEVRALSWESKERQTDFEVRGWILGSVMGAP